MSLNAFVLVVAAIVFGAVSVVQSSGRSWAGWGIICLGVALLVQFLTTWKHVLHP